MLHVLSYHSAKAPQDMSRPIKQWSTRDRPGTSVMNNVSNVWYTALQGSLPP
jgi:hypothetical protein